MSDKFSEGHSGAEVAWAVLWGPRDWQHQDLGPGSDTQPPVPADFQHL